MALFKIEKGLSSNLSKNRPNTQEGWCYFTTDDGKFYIDTNTKAGDTSGRVVLNAHKADMLTVNAGSAGCPVYFQNGIPVAANAYSTLLSEFSSSTNTLTLTIDATSKTASIINSIANTWAGGGAEGPQLTITVNGEAATSTIPSAGETASGIITTGAQVFSGNKTFKGAIIVSKSTGTYNPVLTPSANNAVGANSNFVYVNSNGVITASNVTLGSATKPVWLNGGTITESNATVGTTTQPIYMSAGVITASNATVGSGVNPMFMSSGTLTASNSDVAGATQLMYMTKGTLTASTSDIGGTAQGVYLNKGVITALSANIGDTNIPVYMSSGTITACTATVGSTVNPMYMSGGTLLASDSTVGSGVKPIFLNAGTLTESGSNVGASDKPIFMSGGTLTASTSNIGANNKLIYMSSGTLTASTLSSGGTYVPLYANNGALTTGASYAKAISSITCDKTVPRLNTTTIDGTTGTVALPNLGDLGGIGSITASGTAPLTLTASKSGTSVTISGGVSTAGADSLGVVKGFHRTSAAATGTKSTGASNAPAIAARSTTAGRYYGVETDVNGYMFVNVPWTDTTNFSSTDEKVKTAQNTSSTKLYVTTCSGASSGTTLTYHSGVYVNHSSGVLMGAAWNDFAEYRHTDEYVEPGRVVCENGDDSMSMSTKRMQPAAAVVSDTFGFAIGETEYSKTPIAVAGRVLVHTYENRNSYKPGDAVCAAPGGTVSKMTRDEIRNYPERILGVVSAVPEYETWGETHVKVNDRIWIKIH